VENTFARENLLDIAQQIFSTTELAELAKVPPEHQADRFFQYWTFKESYVKARGRGVSIPLQKLSFLLERNGFVDLEIAPELSDDPSRWQLWQIRPAPGYVLAICAERVQQLSPTILARRAASLDIEEVIPVHFRRISP
jgi:4'-phosphopantetheinyl transferase